MEPTNNSNNVSNIDAVLVRIFGGEGLIDRDVETSTFAALHHSNVLTPKYLVRFQNGRIEGWLHNMHTLETKELSDPNISKALAVALGQLHCKFNIPGELQEFHNVTEPSLWKQLFGWWESSIQAVFQNEHDTNRAILNTQHPSQIQEESVR